MEMKVCSLVQLTKKNDKGEFTKDGKEGKITIRKRVIVPQSSVEEYEGNYASSGLLYVVDEKATAERNKLVETEVNAARNAETEEEDNSTKKAAAQL
jgi:hypothetical protein